MPSRRPLSPERAVDIFAQLLEARQLFLHPALSHAVERVGVTAIDDQLRRYASPAGLTRLASLGIRGERVYPVPVILEDTPTLVGYYRMVLGISQKGFAQHGYARFGRAEAVGKFSPAALEGLGVLCEAFGEALDGLVAELPDFSDSDLNDLALLTLGGTFQGSRNVKIGQAATQSVFRAIEELLEPHDIQERSQNTMVVVNAAGRKVSVTFGADPDVRFDTIISGTPEPILAIEIKGGTDVSNAHNRAGEAEKSHLKARRDGYQHRFTIISLTGIDEATLRNESPSTTRFFDVTEILSRSGERYNGFVRQIIGLIGLPERPEP